MHLPCHAWSRVLLLKPTFRTFSDLPFSPQRLQTNMRLGPRNGVQQGCHPQSFLLAPFIAPRQPSDKVQKRTNPKMQLKGFSSPLCIYIDLCASPCLSIPASTISISQAAACKIHLITAPRWRSALLCFVKGLIARTRSSEAPIE